MLIGEYEYNIDKNGRLNFPSKLRSDMGETFVLCKSVDEKCLHAYSQPAWEQKKMTLQGLPPESARALQRYLFSSAAEMEPDKQGRIIIPANLREFAALERQVIIIGADDRCEIWDKEEWEKYRERNSDKDMQMLAKMLGF